MPTNDGRRAIDNAPVPNAFTCPNCDGEGMIPFYEMGGVPAHSMILLSNAEEACNFACGNIRLASCISCGFVSNVLFDPALERYGADYEASQSFSPTFQAFHERLARDLVSRHNLEDKCVLEIGCGQGEFLELLARFGANPVYGFDPAYRGPSTKFENGSEIVGIRDFYDERYGYIDADFYCCKQTLEHIPDTKRFLTMLRDSIGDSPDVSVFFQVPNFQKILDEGAFWDVYYEHCSYFTRKSLVSLFEMTGFDVLNSRAEYDDQYLMVEARPGEKRASSSPENPAQGAIAEHERFAERCRRQIAAWRAWFEESERLGRSTVLWGGGSKTVAFLSSVGVADKIEAVVDINPRKAHTYLPRSGCRVVPPADLYDMHVDRVVVMNPIYIGEVQRELSDMGKHPEIISIMHFTSE